MYVIDFNCNSLSSPTSQFPRVYPPDESCPVGETHNPKVQHDPPRGVGRSLQQQGHVGEWTLGSMGGEGEPLALPDLEVDCGSQRRARLPWADSWSLLTEEASLLEAGLQMPYPFPEQHNQQILQGTSWAPAPLCLLGSGDLNMRLPGEAP